MILFAGITWCGPCRRELPDIPEIVDRFHPDEVQFVYASINNAWNSLGENTERLQSEMDEHEISIPIIPATDAIRSDYEIRAVPTKYIISRNQVICDSDSQGSFWSTDEFIGRIRRCLNRPYISPEARPGCANAIFSLIRGFGGQRG